MRPRVWTRLALGAAACAATGCTPTALTPTAAPTLEPTLGTLAIPAAPPLTLPAVSPLAFHDCSGAAGLQCATLTVPLDYAAPGGATIAIAVARLPALTSPSRGSIVVNPGGPGE
ncbi:MAG: alpha/beta hydrolase, partial [Candidatus Dormiibacterota bacterium]